MIVLSAQLMTKPDWCILDSMTYRKNFEYVERRVGSVPTDNSTVPYFNASMIIRIPIQPMRSVFIVSRYEYLLVLVIVLFTCLYRTQLIFLDDHHYSIDTLPPCPLSWRMPGFSTSLFSLSFHFYYSDLTHLCFVIRYGSIATVMTSLSVTQ